MEYKLFNTDGKTFFDFRSNPDSRCEGFTVSYLDDGTTVMSGDYGTLCWNRYNKNDYGFPSKETGISYFAEKVCNWGVKQVIEEYNKETFFNNLKENYGDETDWKDFEEEFSFLDEENEWEAFALAEHYFTDAWECGSKKYTNQFKNNFEKLQSVSEQILNAVYPEKKEVKQ